MKKHILAGLSLLVSGSLLLAACSPQANPATPTVDANAIYTQAAQTVQAGIQMTDAVKPTATPSQTPEPTQTVAPTNTMDPSVAADITATVNAAVQVALTPQTEQTPLAGQATAVVLPTATSASAAAPLPAASSGDKCEWVDNKPRDNSQITKNSDFDATIVIKNSGTTTWNTKYAMRYFGGERMGVPGDYYIQREVKPGEMYSFEFVMKSPNSTGKKEVLIAIQNAEGVTMCWVNIPLEIID